MQYAKQMLLRLLALGVLLSVLPLPGGNADEIPLSEKEVFTIATGGDLKIIPVAISGENRQFVIDISARYTTVDSSLQTLLGDKVRQVPVLSKFGITSEWTYQSPILRVGQTEFRPAELHVTKFDAAKAAGGHRFDGTLGLDCLESLVLDFDSDQGKFRLWNSPAPNQICRGYRKRIVLGSDPKWLTLYNSVPGLQGFDPEAFQIATACTDSVGLREDLFDLLVKKGFINGVHNVATSVKNVRSTTGMLHGFRFAGKSFESLLCTRRPLNYIGMGLLSRFHAIIDIPQNVIWLEFGQQIDVPDKRDLSGISVVRFVTDEVVIVDVDPGSPAAKAGIRYADQIVEVRDLEIGHGSLFRLRQRLCEPGRCELTLLRGETPLTVVLDLQ
jgi:hypothetical protein